MEQQLIEFLYACPVGLIECGRDGSIRLMNPHAMQHLLPLGGAEAASNLFYGLERHAPEVRNMIEAFAPLTGPICDSHRIFVDLGETDRKFPKVMSCTIVKLGPDRFMVTLSDVSAQVAQERRLRQADTWFASLINDIHGYAVISISRDGHINSCNRAFEGQTGHGCNDVVGQPLGAILNDDSGASGLSISDQLRMAERDGWFLDEGWQWRKNGDRYWSQRLIVTQMDHDGTEAAGFALVLRDVPRQEGATADLHRLLTRDHLTGAANRMEFRRGLDRILFQWREAGQPAALVSFDLDHFKRVNDAHGHPTGDVLLRGVVAAALEVLRPCDILARLGGEEFGVLLPGLDAETAMAVAERLRQAIAKVRITAGGTNLRPTASFGCAGLEEVDGSAEALIQLSDRRLYVAKRTGRDRVIGSDAVSARNAA